MYISALIEHVQKLEILYEFDVHFHTKLKVRKSSLSCFTDCRKDASAGALIHRQQTIDWSFTQTKPSSNYEHKPIVIYWALKKRQALLTIYAKLKLTIIIISLVAKSLPKSSQACGKRKKTSSEILKRCYIQTY